MIRFKHFVNEEVLLENRIEFLKQQNPSIDTSHDTLAKHKDAGDIIDHFAKKADPTPTKAHTQWIVNQYKKQSIRQEDAPHIKSTLNDFETVKNRLEKKDINQYKDIGELRDAVATQKTHAVKAVKAKKVTAEKKTADLEKMYDEDGVTGYKIPNKESSIRNYGPAGVVKPTHWCTAANSGNNMFNQYKGGKYTMHFPNDEVLQFHHQSNQIMDKHDRPVQEGDPRFAPYEHHISKFIHQTKAVENDSKIDRFHHFEPHEIDDVIADHKKALSNNNNDPGSIRYHESTRKLSDVVTKAKLSEHQFNAIHELPLGKDYAGRPEGASLKLSNNKKLTHEQVGKLLHSPDENVREHHEEQLVRNPAVKDDHIDTLLRSPRLSNNVKRHLADNPNLRPHHIDKLIKDPEAHEKLANNHEITLSPSHQSAIVDSGRWKEGFAQRSDLHPDTVEHLLGGDHGSHIHQHLIHNENVHLNDSQLRHLHAKYNTKSDTSISGYIFDSPKTSPEIREHVFKTHLDHLERRGGEGSSSALDTMVRSKHFTKDHLDRLLDVADRTDVEGKANPLRSHAARYLKASPAQIDRQVNAPGRGMSATSDLLDNKNLKPDHLKSLFTTAAAGSGYEYHKEKVMEHPSVNADVLHHVFDKGHSWDRTRVLHHPKVQASHFQKAMDVGQSLHGAISSSPSAPPSTLSKLADSPFSFVRQNVAEHKNTPQETVAKLANDSADEVSSAAKKRLKLK